MRPRLLAFASQTRVNIQRPLPSRLEIAVCRLLSGQRLDDLDHARDFIFLDFTLPSVRAVEIIETAIFFAPP